ncbi:ATP-dependent dethiobiotin synthetase BioD 1 [Marinobacterium sp. xm-g-59]|uniref:dethiobiotin synthase n=1 Tax=Marinobacterium sp. xm-g-59 TaxID=2497748 RepID=UPI001569A6B9|nr:dethiobiotin synthase [Marinobacterium sp. xm-g-59]NRP95293.1 ATP-dependent dethiobiotin synthetase BioD 1 [Marinobacterium sp. xm-g-59]
MKQRFFVTGTEVSSPVNEFSCALLKQANQKGFSSLGLKPVATGCSDVDGELKSQEALNLMACSSIELSYFQVNPFSLAANASPHIAAEMADVRMSADRIKAYMSGALMRSVNLALVEGVSGWRAPINDRESMASVAQALGFPVILVVSLNENAINQTLLTLEAIRRDGLTLAGWVVSHIQSEVEQQSVDWLHRVVPAPLLGAISSEVGESDELDLVQLGL